VSVVVVTGASSGIGREAALAFARRGDRVALIARDADALREVAELAGDGARVYPADVTDAAALSEVARRVRHEMGGLDVWVNNAGVGAVGSFTDVPLEHHHRVLGVNVGGYYNGAHAALKIFEEQRRGTLINVASISSYIAQPTSAAYVTSKFAIRGLVYSLRQDVALARLKDVRVCLVHPQVVDTPVFEHMANFSGTRVDLKLPTVSAARVARAIVRAADRPRREIYVGVFGRIGVLGHRFFPGISEWLMMRLARYYYDRRPHDQKASAGNLFESSR
jgi:short-subunit dehydrogenase